jgi:sulfonate transport system substrate-binding protein
VQRVVRAFVKAARFAADEKNRAAVFDLWAKTGNPAESYREDFANEPLANRLTPLIAPYVLARYRDQAQRTRDYGLLRKDVDVDGWADPRYLDRALDELHLQHFWPTYDANGKKLTSGEVDTSGTATQ